ncbi:hypothetical protein ACDP63_24055 [Paracoccus sp. P2]|uniref:hypothetical protein n=1 Tax=Paracoccus sp. P2 TaxID=3248840 RepID=UPI00391EF51E
MSKVSSTSVQPVATQAPHGSEASFDVMGFMTGTLEDLTGVVGYVRQRRPQPDKIAGSDPLAYEKRILHALAAADAAPLPANSAFAREALKFIAIAEKIISDFPIEHREAARQLFHATRHATLHESTAILRRRAADKAKRGEKQLRDIHNANLASRKWHIGDEELFLQIDALTGHPNERNGKKLNSRSALKKIKYPSLLGTPEKRWPMATIRDLDATLRRYYRHKKNLDAYQTSK